MEIFLHGSGRKNASLQRACSNLAVFIPFVLSRLLGEDVQWKLGEWLHSKDWQQVDCWKLLCERWDFRWEKPRKGEGNQGNYTSIWRLALMVETWRLLDEHYLRGWHGDLGIYPSVSEISDAAKVWIERENVSLTQSENILSKINLRFSEIASDWIPRMGLKKPPGDCCPEEWWRRIKEAKPVEGCRKPFTGKGWEEIARNMVANEDSYDDVAAKELEYLRGLDWPEG